MSETEPRHALSTNNDSNQLDIYHPSRHRLTAAAFEFGIDEAKRIRDWPALERAVDGKIEEQRRFVAWWGANVRQAGQPKVLPAVTGNTLPRTEAERLTGMRNQRVSDLGKRLQRPDTYRKSLLGVAYQEALLSGADNVRGTQGTGENEWFTPPEYIKLARQVLGRIDLDPASSKQAQKVVKATKYFTKKNDGLGQEWRGRVWLNPPYAQPLISQFASKMVMEKVAKRVKAAIMLTHNYTDTTWFHEAAYCADAICFTRGRIKFYEPNGSVAACTQGQAFFYFGPNHAKFATVFRDVGFVVRQL